MISKLFFSRKSKFWCFSIFLKTIFLIFNDFLKINLKYTNSKKCKKVWKWVNFNDFHTFFQKKIKFWCFFILFKIEKSSKILFYEFTIKIKNSKNKNFDKKNEKNMKMSKFENFHIFFSKTIQIIAFLFGINYIHILFLDRGEGDFGGQNQNQNRVEIEPKNR